MILPPTHFGLGNRVESKNKEEFLCVFPAGRIGILNTGSRINVEKWVNAIENLPGAGSRTAV
jgi:hypothetical protein